MLKKKREKPTEILIDNKKVRFSDAPWADSLHTITIGGVGGIGSWVSLFLARIGHTLNLFDMDSIDETNMAGQLYSISQIGVNKAEAIKTNIANFCGEENVVMVNTMFDENSNVSPIMFSCFDNMAARELMFNKWKAQENRVIFIDGRMLAEVGNVFIVLPGDEEKYQKTLFADSEVKDAPCSFKATSHCGAFIASIMVSALNNHLANLKFPNIRELDFQIDFELPLLLVTNTCRDV